MLELKCQKLVHSTSKQNILQQRQKANEKTLRNDHHNDTWKQNNPSSSLMSSRGGGVSRKTKNKCLHLICLSVLFKWAGL